MESVVVAVCTRGRPASLARLLASLVAHAPQARVLVIDNDPHGSARPTVEAAVGAVSYIHEPRVGIPQARNAAFDAA
jgi:glycosyltransferase involved in cell wall biosynthesis